MDVRALNNPFSKSLFLHLLLMLMVVFFATIGPKLNLQDEPITVKLIDVKKGENQKSKVFDGEKDRIVKENKSATTGGFYSGKRVISVKDLGVKIDTEQSTPVERRRNWAQEALGEDIPGGQYVKGLKEEETSALNTKENIFFSYTNRMRGQLYQRWAPIIRREIERYYGMGFSFQENTYFETQTKIVLNHKGEIIKVQLLQESGVVDLDDAALTALNQAGPYPNPPKGLQDEKGNAELHWNFILRN